MTYYVSSGTLNPTHSLTHSNTDLCCRFRLSPAVMKHAVHSSFFIFRFQLFLSWVILFRCDQCSACLTMLSSFLLDTSVKLMCNKLVFQSKMGDGSPTSVYLVTLVYPVFFFCDLDLDLDLMTLMYKLT